MPADEFCPMSDRVRSLGFSLASDTNATPLDVLSSTSSEDSGFLSVLYCTRARSSGEATK